MVTISGFLPDPAQLPPPHREDAKGGGFAGDVFSHPYNADLAKCLKQVLVTALLDTTACLHAERPCCNHGKKCQEAEHGGSLEPWHRVNDGLSPSRCDHQGTPETQRHQQQQSCFLRDVPAVKRFQIHSARTNRQHSRRNHPASYGTDKEPAPYASLRRFRPDIFHFSRLQNPIVVHGLLALQFGADLGYLLHYYRASRGIRLGDISSNEVGCLL